MKRTRPAVGNSLVLGAATTRNVPKQWDPKLQILPHGWYLQWLENKDYVRTDILLNDKATMQALVRLARKASATPTEIQLCDDDEDIAENCAEVADDDAAESIADEPVNPAVESLTVAAESVTDDVLPVTAEAVSTTAEAVSAGEAAVPVPVPVVPVPVPVVPVPTTVPAVPASDGRATVSQYAQSIASSSSTTEYERPNKNEQTYIHNNANAKVDDTDEHEELIRQLDLLRMRFKECKIPQSVEQGNASTVELRNTVQRNMLQLK